jgi:hypothetical protein
MLQKERLLGKVHTSSLTMNLLLVVKMELIEDGIDRNKLDLRWHSYLLFIDLRVTWLLRWLVSDITLWIYTP